MAFFVQLAIAVAMMIISYILMPKPKTPKPDSAKDLEAPTAEAGREIPVIFGDLTLKDPNCLWFGEKFQRQYKVSA